MGKEDAHLAQKDDDDNDNGNATDLTWNPGMIRPTEPEASFSG